MKFIHSLALLLSLTQMSCASIQNIEMRVHIHDEAGNAVEGAVVNGGFYDDVLVNKVQRNSHKGITNKEGFTVLSGEENFYIELTITKNGFYASHARINVADGEGRNISVLLRKIHSPVKVIKQMIVKTIPELDKKIEFDFFKGDFSGEGFKGSFDDVTILFEQDVISINNFTQTASFSFNNNNDGFVKFKIKPEWLTSDYKTPYKAPRNGYEQILLVKSIRDKVSYDRSNQNSPFFIRIRTVLDEKGNVKEAYYCKVWTGIKLYGVLAEKPSFGMSYVCNPNVNDRNMESLD